MEDTQFRECFRRILDKYELTPDAAEALLRRILKILARGDPPEEKA